jgi:hypothetical protein
MRTLSLSAIAALLAAGAVTLATRDTAHSVTAAHEYNHVIGAVMNGRPGGDTDGFGSFSAVISGRKLCYGIQVTGIRPIAAHIHRGAAGEDGPIAVALNLGSGNPAVGSACTRVSRDLVGSLKERPGRFYVNVHTNEFPGGAVRGQLVHPRRSQVR